MYGEPTVIDLRPEKGFVETEQVTAITDRALSYLRCGVGVHFSGPAGSGKTTLAMHLARKLRQPAVLVYGDDEYGSSDLVGGEYGYHKKKIIDNFIHSVLKTEESARTYWVDNRLTHACRNGFTFIYDEFSRSRPEANNILLSVLEERLLPLPQKRDEAEEDFIQVNPRFRAIFTSNPEEYAGVHKTQDALVDRMVTITLDHYDREAEIAITAARSRVSLPEATVIVNVVRGFRDLEIYRLSPSVRACIIIAKAAKLRKAKVSGHDSTFRQICNDVLTSESLRGATSGQREKRMSAYTAIRELIEKYC